MSLIERAADRLDRLAREGASNAATPPPGMRRLPPRQSRQIALDLPLMQQAGLLVPSLDGTRLADEFRHLKRSLLANAGEPTLDAMRRNALVMVTSALPAEGKTYCAINLAMSLAMEIDISVLLVDADVMGPSLLGRMGLVPERGLLDVLSDPSVDLADVLLRTDVPKLSVLPTGTPSARASELLGSSAMQRLLEEMASRYPDRIVIFDGPPLLLAPGAQTLAGQVGQVVMVVEASRTPRSAVVRAFEALANCKHVMSVLNKCDLRPEPAMGSYYGEPPTRLARR